MEKSSRDQPDATAETALFAAEISTPPAVDLHGMSVNEALSTLTSFLHGELLRRTEAICIIHGRGTGALRNAIHAWLKAEKNKPNGLVLAYRDSSNPAHAGGATLVALADIGGKRSA